METVYREIEWTNGLRPGSHRAWLLLADKTSDKLMYFRGESIPGVCRVLSKSGTKNGKWSNITYRIRLGHSVDAFAGVGRYDEALSRAAGLPQGAGWARLAARFGVSPDAVRQCIAEENPALAELVDTFDQEGV